ncbi:MAG TPA: hypothetical protein PLT40_10730 [Ilumatobacteraceae bacterium]|jgi:hypothetical protein|nr:hypothetical protein [Ilumatobacteraceae bacterium]MBP7890423.1 hypothetical protein [Ilumatobacteraceae bacterium]MBP9052550.1 hypothetical protein [Ilumatobacteraceae bacterium]HRA84796.1 hypothetical protein [Ilumatobacteraceae bacterium]
MANGRRDAVTQGQRSLTPSRAVEPALRSRVNSGIRIGQHPPLKFLRLLDELREVIDSVGSPCWAYGTTASALLGFDGFHLAKPFHLVVPINRAPHRVDHIVHRMRTYNQLDLGSVHGIPSLSATRTLIELARTEATKRLTTALDSAVRDGLTTDDFLHRRMMELRRRGRPGLDKLLAVMAGAELSKGGHSWLERSFLDLLGELGLPRPITQQVVATRRQKLVRVDCRFPGTNVIVELLGYAFHRTPMQMQNDAERLNRLQLDGFTAMQFTYHDVVTTSPVMVATLHEALPPAPTRPFGPDS